MAIRSGCTDSVDGTLQSFFFYHMFSHLFFSSTDHTEVVCFWLRHRKVHLVATLELLIVSHILPEQMELPDCPVVAMQMFKSGLIFPSMLDEKYLIQFKNHLDLGPLRDHWLGNLASIWSAKLQWHLKEMSAFIRYCSFQPPCWSALEFLYG